MAGRLPAGYEPFEASSSGIATCTSDPATRDGTAVPHPCAKYRAAAHIARSCDVRRRRAVRTRCSDRTLRKAGQNDRNSVVDHQRRLDVEVEPCGVGHGRFVDHLWVIVLGDYDPAAAWIDIVSDRTWHLPRAPNSVMSAAVSSLLPAFARVV
jgi:hypothetical protein